jgi:hypothetical protein
LPELSLSFQNPRKRSEECDDRLDGDGDEHMIENRDNNYLMPSITSPKPMVASNTNDRIFRIVERLSELDFGPIIAMWSSA